MHKPESILDDETNRIVKDFEIRMDHIIPASRQDLLLIKKEKELAV